MRSLQYLDLRGLLLRMLRRRPDFLLLTMKKTKKLVLASICASLGVIVLYFGVFLEALDMTAAVFASVFVLFAVLELGFSYGGAVYALIALIGFLLLPNKSPTVFFTVLFGYVPMAKFFFEKHLGKIAWLPKLLLYNAMLCATTALGSELIGFSLENAYGIAPWIVLVAYAVLANVVLVVCDILYKRLAFLYLKKYRDKLKKFLK